jgi:TolA-binding protein
MAKKKQQEETIVDVQEVYTKTEMFVDRNRKMLSIVLGGVALLFCIFYGYRYLVVIPKEKEAMNNIWKAQLYFENDSLDLALNGDDLYPGFEDIAIDFEGSKTGQLANYYLGIIHRDQGDYELALENFEKCDFDDDAIGVLAMANVGDMHVELGDLESGAVWMNKAATRAKSTTSANYSAPLVLFKYGVVLLELERFAEAKAVFEDIRDNYPEATEYFDKATKYAASLSRY